MSTLNRKIVTANLKISLRVPCADQKTVRRTIQTLISSTDLQKLYQVGVSNRFAVLSNILTDKKNQEKYDEILNILEKANDTVLPKKVIHREKYGLVNRQKL